MSLGYLSDIMSMFNSGPLTGYPPNLQTYYTSFMTITVAELYILLTDLSAVTGGDTGAAPPDGGWAGLSCTGGATGGLGGATGGLVIYKHIKCRSKYRSKCRSK